MSDDKPSNIKVLPKWIPDQECRDLLAWVDSLEIGELQNLKKALEENAQLKAELEITKQKSKVRGQSLLEVSADNQRLQRDLEKKSKEIGMSEHRGNTVDYIYDKCQTYGDQVMKLGNENRQLKAAGKGLVEALKGIVEGRESWVKDAAENAIATHGKIFTEGE
jgi:hypothetical protein